MRLLFCSKNDRLHYCWIYFFFVRSNPTNTILNKPMKIKLDHLIKAQEIALRRLIIRSSDTNNIY